MSDLDKRVRKATQYVEPNIISIGIVGIGGFSIYYFVWNYLYPQPYESLFLRVASMIVLLPILVFNRLPKNLKNGFHWYFFASAIYLIPFYFSYMLIKNEFSHVWHMSCIAGILFLVILFYDYLLITLKIVIGFSLACLSVWLTDGAISFDKFQPEFIPVYLFAFLGGVLFGHRTETSHAGKLQYAQALGGNVAHEMRNPLSAVSNLLDQVQYRLRNAGEHKMNAEEITQIHYLLDTMKNCTRRANQVIDIILANLRGEHTEHLMSEILSVQEVIKLSLEEYAYNNEEEKRRIHYIEGPDFLFKGEKTALMYSLFNLIKNALYYIDTHPQSVITISTAKAEQGATYNKLIVRDTGPGIAADKIKSIFNAFHTSGKMTGTGLGLHFVQKTMSHFRGKVECHSSETEFTEFILSFPVHAEEPAAIKPATPVTPIKIITQKLPVITRTAADIKHKGKKILLVDDETINRMAIRHLLEATYQLTVIEANNGAAALNILRDEKEIKLVFTDISMPVMDGFEFTKNVRTNVEFHDYKNVPIVAITGSDGDDILHKVYNSGMNHCLNKVFPKEVLVDILDHIKN